MVSTNSVGVKRAGTGSIAQMLNDALREKRIRCAIYGGVKEWTGAIRFTAAFQGEPDMWVIGALQTVQNFSAFNAENDPEEEHKLILTRYEGKEIRAQFSYYEDDTIQVAAKDARECYRVLTIGMADEDF